VRGISGRGTVAVAYVLLLFGAAITLFPIALMLINACKASVDIVTNPLALPLHVRWINFSHAWRDARLGSTFINSAIVSAVTILLVCSTGSMTAYVIARRRVRQWRLLGAYLLGSTTLPIQLFLFPLYFGFAHLGLIDSRIAVAFIYTAIYSPFAILLLRTYFLGVPQAIEDAARIDGANTWQVFTHVMLPIVQPGILTVALIIALYTWNEFLIATTFLQDRGTMTAIVSFFLLGGQYTSDWGEIMAASVLVILPVVALFLILQHRFIEGMAGGSVKG
jgi:raffinose/stachyose/melibiose transport system permease protein